MDNSIYNFFENILKENDLEKAKEKMRDWFNSKKPLSKALYDSIILSIRIIYQEMLLVKEIF
jgi:hypothetical protein